MTSVMLLIVVFGSGVAVGIYISSQIEKKL